MKVLTFEDEALHTNCERVDRFDRSLRDLIMEMFHTMTVENGCGLAANQVGILKRIIVVDDRSRRFPLINPRIVRYSENKIDFEEGCLSSMDRGLLCRIRRPEWIIVEFQNEYGKRRRLKASGLLSRIIQHEVDHLNGITMLDFLEASQKERHSERNPSLVSI